jgi:shikimate dehydrogenase
MIEIRGTTRLAGVMGWPIGHSRSPRLHNYWLAKHGIDGAYVPLPIRPENLASALHILPVLGFVGVNVTVPHKETARRLIDRVDPIAQRIGAVNTIVVAKDGRLEGLNTDAEGFLAGLRQEAPTWNPAAPAVVLGAGGSARAVVTALVEAGLPEIRVTNRTRGRAEALSGLGAGVRAVEWAQRSDALADAGLLVNTTSLGMKGEPPLEINLSKLPEKTVVNDIVYSPLDTDLLVRARARGNWTVDGLGMLLHQARFAFRAFFGVDPAVTPELRQYVLAG